MSLIMSLKAILRSCAYAAQGYAIAHCTLEYIGEIGPCEGASMEPTIFTNDRLLTEKMSVRRNPPRLQRGDIVIFKSPNRPKILVGKRIIGLPGDVILSPRLEIPYAADETVVIKDRSLNRSVNLVERNDEHLVDKLRYKRIVVPKGHIWVEGDNSAHSSDSRHYGPIPMGLIRGRVIARVYPFSEMKCL